MPTYYLLTTYLQPITSCQLLPICPNHQLKSITQSHHTKKYQVINQNSKMERKKISRKKVKSNDNWDSDDSDLKDFQRPKPSLKHNKAKLKKTIVDKRDSGDSDDFQKPTPSRDVVPKTEKAKLKKNNVNQSGNYFHKPI